MGANFFPTAIALVPKVIGKFLKFLVIMIPMSVVLGAVQIGFIELVALFDG